MSETTVEQTAEATGASEQTSTEATTEQAEQTAERVDGEDALGDKGKKALDAMKAERNAAREEARKAREEADALKAAAEGREAEHRAEQERRATEREALEKANDRIRRSEVKAAAKGVLADPADAYKFLNLEEFEVDDDGNVDEQAIADALADLVKSKPYLAVQDGKRFQGDPDAGARNEARPAQLTQSDLDRMTPEQISEARKKGQLDDLLGIKR